MATKSPSEAIGLFLKAAPGSFRSVMEVAVAETGRKISCVMSDAFFGFAGKMAEEMDVPWVPLWTAGPRSLLSHVDTEVIRQTLGTSGKHSFNENNMHLEFFVFYSLARIFCRMISLIVRSILMGDGSICSFLSRRHFVGYKIMSESETLIGQG